jgi:hypothetical protein
MSELASEHIVKRTPKFLRALLIGSNFLSVACINIAGECENTSEKEVISPDGRRKVVIYDRGCGATTGFITGISILPVNQDVTDSDEANVMLAGNIVRNFTIDPSGKRIDGEMNFDARWYGNELLTVYYLESRFIEKHANFDGIAIRFLPISELKK